MNAAVSAPVAVESVRERQTATKGVAIVSVVTRR